MFEPNRDHAPLRLYGTPVGLKWIKIHYNQNTFTVLEFSIQYLTKNVF